MCYCKYCRWGECTYEGLEPEEIEKLDNGELDETNCPHFCVYWADEEDPYGQTAV